ncbi:MAG: hypothetical protein GYA35_05290 [Thermoanaerobaculaceae bacterium]|nr:hypothetical protein [Thermoanaerobaculaceae bacterium]
MKKTFTLFISMSVFFIFSNFSQSALPPECFYEGYTDPLSGENYIPELSSPYGLIQTNGQNYQVAFSVTNITPDVAGMLIRVSRLKTSEGDHPSDQGNDNGNPRSDEDKVQYAFYILQGLSPQSVFRGEYSKDGNYQLNGQINLGEDISVAFGDLQTDKEYRVQFIIWSTFMAGGGAFTKIPLSETRFKVVKFDKGDAKYLSVKRKHRWDNQNQSPFSLIEAKWFSDEQNRPKEVVCFWKDKYGNKASFTEKPLKEDDFKVEYIEATKIGAEAGSKIGIQDKEENILVSAIGGGGIIENPCLPQCTAPPAPVLLSVSEHRDFPQGLEVKWSSVPNAVYYDIFRSSSCSFTSYPIGIMGSSDCCAFVDAFARPGNTYAYRIKAVAGSQQTGYCPSEFSNCLSAYYSCQTCLPLPSPSLLYPPNGATELCPKPSFSWENVTNNEGYLFELFTTPNTTGTPFLSVKLAKDTTAFAISSQALPPSTTCSWRVKTIGDGDCHCDSDFSAPFVFTTKEPCTILSPPTIIRPCNNLQVCPNPPFEWSYDSNATGGYKLEIYDSTGTNLIMSTIIPQPSLPVSTVIWQDSGLLQGSYTWRVQALGDNYCYYCNSSFTPLCSFYIQNTTLYTVKLIEPENGTSNEYTSPLLNWLPVSETTIAYYKAKVFTGSCDANLFALSPNLTSTEWYPSLQSGTTYYWKVEAIDTEGCTIAVSGCWSFQTGATCN